MLTQHVRVDPQRDGRIGVAEAGSYHVDGYPGEEQCGGVQVPQIVQSGTRRTRRRTKQTSGAPEDTGAPS